MHRMGVTFVLDRAGVTGPDGPSRDGVWDTSLTGIVPGLRLAAPRDAERLHDALHEALEVNDAPTVIRYSKDKLPDPIPAERHVGGVDVLRHAERHDVLVIGYGQMAGTALQVADRLTKQGLGVSVIDPLWALPVPPALVRLAADYSLVVTIEDGMVVGGLGSRVELALDAEGVDVPVREFGIPQEFLPMATRAELMEQLGLTPRQIARDVTELAMSVMPHVEFDLDDLDDLGTQDADPAAMPAGPVRRRSERTALAGSHGQRGPPAAGLCAAAVTRAGYRGQQLGELRCQQVLLPMPHAVLGERARTACVVDLRQWLPDQPAQRFGLDQVLRWHSDLLGDFIRRGTHHLPTGPGLGWVRCHECAWWGRPSWGTRMGGSCLADSWPTCCDAATHRSR